jgi:hypothetical protein
VLPKIRDDDVSSGLDEEVALVLIQPGALNLVRRHADRDTARTHGLFNLSGAVAEETNSLSDR